MAHKLTFRADGKANMAYVGATPWHGFGQLLTPGADLATWIANAGFDWEALIVPAQYEHNGVLLTAPNAFHMVRSDTGASLSVMSNRYKPAQPADIMAWMRDFVLVDPRFTLETAGVLKGGNVIWALARFTENMQVNGEDHACYAFITTSFDGSLATTVQTTVIRVVCNNTATAALYDKRAQIKVPHYHDFGSSKVQADASARLAAVAQGFTQYKAVGEALAHINMSVEDTVNLFKRLTVGEVEKPSTKALNQLDALVQAYRDTLREGTPANTGWAAFNAVTRYVDHSRTVRDTQGDGASAARMSSSLLGTGAAMKRDALADLARMGCLTLEGLGIDTSLSQAIQPAEVDAPVEFDHAKAGAFVLDAILNG